MTAIAALAVALAFACGACGAQQLSCLEDEMESASSQAAALPEPWVPPAPVAAKRHWRLPSNALLWRLENLASIGTSSYQQADALMSTRRLKNRGMREGQLGAAMLAGGVTAVSLAVDAARRKRRHGGTR